MGLRRIFPIFAYVFIHCRMGLEFHKDKPRYFEMQRVNAEAYVIPFIESKFPLTAGMRVLEIGCAEGGVLKAFLDHGLEGVGVELSPARAKQASEFLAPEIEAGKAQIISRNIYDVDFMDEIPEKFDIIVLKDVIEHIHDHRKLIDWMKTFLRPGGHIFFGFPPWMMPFGGHQQISSKKILRKLPWYHLMPRFMYKGWLKLWGEKKGTVDELLEIQETRITIERFERIAKKTGYSIVRRQQYLINPIYKYKFGWKPRKQARWMAGFPWVRNFWSTCVYYLITPQKEPS